MLQQQQQQQQPPPPPPPPQLQPLGDANVMGTPVSIDAAYANAFGLPEYSTVLVQ
jgi:hypothetical protein